MRHLLKYVLSLVWLTAELAAKNVSFDTRTLSTYEYMNRYYKDTSLATIYETCTDFVCEESGLNKANIELLVKSENTARDRFAIANKFSNVYAVKWNSYLASAARKKLMLCLPPTLAEHIIDSKIITDSPFWNKLKSLGLPTAAEVVISKSITYINRDQEVQDVYMNLANSMIHFLDDDYLNNPDSLARRGNTLIMGCDYLVRNNRTHVIGHLVCVYALMFFTGRYGLTYTPQKGVWCSECSDFFERYPSLTAERNFIQRWGCDLIYEHLCRDFLNHYEDIPRAPKRFDCAGSSATPSSVEITTSDELQVRLPPPVEVTISTAYDWPCMRYTVPLVLFVVIVLILIIYNVVWVVIIRWRARKRRKSFSA